MLKLWISYSTGSNTSSLKELSLQNKNLTSVLIKNEIRKLFNIPASKILRLRNSDESLIPIDRNLVSNTKKKHYKLEALNECNHENKDCKHKILANDQNQNEIAQFINRLNNRLSKIDTNIENCKLRTFTDAENASFKDTEKQLNFIELRINEASQYTWNGIIKKQPLW